MTFASSGSAIEPQRSLLPGAKFVLVHSFKRRGVKYFDRCFPTVKPSTFAEHATLPLLKREKERDYVLSHAKIATARPVSAFPHHSSPQSEQSSPLILDQVVCTTPIAPLSFPVAVPLPLPLDKNSADIGGTTGRIVHQHSELEKMLYQRDVTSINNEDNDESEVDVISPVGDRAHTLRRPRRACVVRRERARTMLQCDGEELKRHGGPTYATRVCVAWPEHGRKRLGSNEYQERESYHKSFHESLANASERRHFDKVEAGACSSLAPNSGE